MVVINCYVLRVENTFISRISGSICSDLLLIVIDVVSNASFLTHLICNRQTVPKRVSRSFGTGMFSLTLRINPAAYDRKSMLETKYSLPLFELGIVCLFFFLCFDGFYCYSSSLCGSGSDIFRQECWSSFIFPRACLLIILLDMVLGIVFGKTWCFL